jgi:hypothetical protein
LIVHVVQRLFQPQMYRFLSSCNCLRIA